MSFINRRDLEFILYDVMGAESLCDRTRFADHSREIFDEMLTVAIRLATDKFEPHAAKLDEHEPHWDGEKLDLIPEVKEAVDAFVEAGFMGTSFDEADGGMQLPYTMAQAFMAIFYAANISTSGYPLLTAAAANLLREFASEEQKARFMRPMLAGRFFGTMCLSEPQAGSSLSDVRTLAYPQDDGTYHLEGNKMWISAGEHELSESIVHLVLARLPDAPAGTKGISLFIVPKHHISEDGVVGERNGVELAGLNHKMGYRGTVNTVLSFGDGQPAVGHMIGEPNQGLKYMFHMMNEARVGVGLGAVMLGYAGYLYSLEYAKERPQGRHPDQRDPTQPPVSIIEHADVRRMLLTQKSYVEGGLALEFYCARLIDDLETLTEEAEKEKADLLLQILTPIAKAWPSEFCLEANKLAIQVLGGYGYTRDYPVERLYRDNRLNAIHEGTNGIQGLDLLGRKVTMKGGAAFRALVAEMQTTLAETEDVEALSELRSALAAAIATVSETTMTLGGAAMQGKVRLFLANSHEYLHMLGHTVIAWMWLKQAAVAVAAQDNATGAEADFLNGKLHAAQFFTRYELPRIERQAALLQKLDDTTLTMEPGWF